MIRWFFKRCAHEIENLMDRSREAGYLRSLLNIETERRQIAERAVLELDRRLALFGAEWRAQDRAALKGFAYAGDESIAAYAKTHDDEKVARIADLTRLLAREQARVCELGDALEATTKIMKAKKRGERSSETAALVDSLNEAKRLDDFEDEA